jgi:hypothetical protein
MFKCYNIVKAIASGEALDKWKAAAPGLIIPGFWTEIAGTKPEEIRSLRKDFLEGRYAVLGEVLNQYDGLEFERRSARTFLRPGCGKHRIHRFPISLFLRLLTGEAGGR